MKRFPVWPSPQELLTDWLADIEIKEFIPPTTNFNRQFLDLLQRIFVYDPKQRITAKEALKHPWFKESHVDDGTEAYRLGQLNRGIRSQ